MQSKIKTRIVSDYEAMSQYCADLVEECVREKPDSLLCFPAGSTAVRTFEILRERNKEGKIDFSKTNFVALDEWLGLSKEAEEENCTHFMRKNLYDPLKIPEDRLCLFDVHAKDYEKECQKIDAFISVHGGIDLMFLGVGMNGHLGLNEPGSPFDSGTRVVELAEVTKQVGQKYFTHPTRLTKGITIGIHHMFQTKSVVLQVSGVHKQEIMKKIYEGPLTEEVPATVFRLLPGGMIVADQAAAKLIRDDEGNLY